MPVRLRRAALTDIPALEALAARAVRAHAPSHYAPEQVAALLEAVSTFDRSLVEEGTLLVAEYGPVLVGTGGWSRRRGALAAAGAPPGDPDVDPATLRAFFVAPEQGRLGIGRALLARVEQEAVESGFRRARVLSLLGADAFFRRCGYGEISRMTLLLGENVLVRSVLLRKDLARSIDSAA